MLPVAAAAEKERRRRAREVNRKDEGLADFVVRVTPEFDRPVHLHPLIDAIERTQTEEVFACIHAPPRHSKTETLKHGIVYLLERDPTLKIGYASYSADIANEKCVEIRKLAVRAGVKMGRKNTEAAWHTAAGGGVFSAGRNGPFNGKGFPLIIIDDPFKNREEAESKTIRRKLVEWLTSTVLTRLEPGGSLLIGHTRWNVGDLIGKLTEKGNPLGVYENICLKAINDNGEALWPERWPVELLESRRERMSEMDWFSLFQGEPRPRGGTLFNGVHYYQEVPTSGYRAGGGLDFAYTVKTKSDHNILIEGVAVGKQLYVTNAIRKKMRSHEFKKVLEVQRKLHPHVPWVAYASGMEKGVVDLLNEESEPYLDIEVEHASTDKFLRAQPVAGAWNDGNVLVPDPEHISTPWLSTFLGEILEFTGVDDDEDDQVDGLAGLFKAVAVPDDIVVDSSALAGLNMWGDL